MMGSMPSLEDIMNATKPHGDKDITKHKILAFDPGETVGWCAFEGLDKLADGHIQTKDFDPLGIHDLRELFNKYKPDIVIYETYRVYDWKTDSHSWSEVHTLQIIGLIRYFCMQHEIEYFKQSAQVAKAFCTDDKLLAWNMYTKNRHSRDAVRHALNYLLFGRQEDKKSKMNTSN